MAVVRLFASAREAAGADRVELAGATVREVLAAARGRFGEDFAEVLETCRIWVNGEPVDTDDVATDHAVADQDEVAVLPPVSGGA